MVSFFEHLLDFNLVLEQIQVTVKKMFKKVQSGIRENGTTGSTECHESLDNESVADESLGENEDISTDYEYWNIPRKIRVISI